jgi:predicted nucleic acid-binding protein
LITKKAVKDNLLKKLKAAIKLEKRIEMLEEKLPGKPSLFKRIEKIEKRIDKIKVKNTGLCQKVRKDFGLGEGEAEAIVLCVENKADLITDDKKAINACRILNVRFTTTGMLLGKLYGRGRITQSEAKMYVKKLETFGRYSKNALQKIREDLEK